MKYIKTYILLISAILFFGCTEISAPKEREEKTINYKIEYIYDGDTLSLIIDGKKEKIRILGIDTPEVDGYRTAECYGDDASAYAKEYLKKKRVTLLKSKIGDEKDRYERLLRYVFVEGKDFGAHLIKEGYAESYKIFPHDRMEYYNELEKEAQENKKGMWNEENCSYWE